MDRLWSPWRYGYVSKARASDPCIFCEKASQNQDRENLVVYRGRLNLVLLNLYPYTTGHLMIAPYQHGGSFADFPTQTLHEMMDLSQQCTRALRLVFSPDGLNLGFNLGAAAGAGIKDHLHLHLVPRWQGDTNFMPVLADVRVIPQSLDESYELLVEAFARLERAEG